ncbi:hypothetical protein CEXT_238001 [Caerostris extrusa]|uniref:Uncharacterized protein n=1 Tax=Caerostris extrusa TaxID=172846 RepID=A0AAV4QDL4_CAEEX|nr:hypothetical protein CEXT_238001 [Caerostris extrusa]
MRVQKDQPVKHYTTKMLELETTHPMASLQYRVIKHLRNIHITGTFRCGSGCRVSVQASRVRNSTDYPSGQSNLT